MQSAENFPITFRLFFPFLGDHFGLVNVRALVLSAASSDSPEALQSELRAVITPQEAPPEIVSPNGDRFKMGEINKVSLQELQQHPLWVELSGPQQQFIAGVTEGFNVADATKRAYPKIASENIKAMTHRLMRIPSVRTVLDIFFQITPKQRFLTDLEEAAARARGSDKIEALKLVAIARGYIPTDEFAEQSAVVVTGE